MQNIPGHSLPNYSEDAVQDTLFHYTTAAGLIGIFQSEQFWSTAYFCANDESELATGKGVLTQIFRSKCYDMMNANDPRVEVFRSRGTDIRDFSDKLESKVISITLSSLSAYITCFCKPTSKEDFHHGLLSQWRGYGSDGGYAIQFSRDKLLKEIEKTNQNLNINYELKDVFYSKENELKQELEGQREALIKFYLEELDEITKPLQELFSRKTMPNPVTKLFGGPLESLLDYLIQTKNEHFAEESECRLSHTQLSRPHENALPVNFYNRNGLLVPYTKTPKDTFKLLDCIDWILIGPGPRLEARMKSISQLVRQSGKDIKIRPSHIPFTRL